MNKRIAFGLLIALVVCGCQIKEDGELAPEGKTFTAMMEALVDGATDVDTKTSMDSYGNVLWKKGDQVSIFAGSAINEHYQVTDASDGKTAAALNPVESSGFVASGDIPNNVAYYPYAATTAIAKRSGGAYLISDIVLPATQTYAAASFGNGAFPMTAVTSSISDYNLKFKNVLGGLKLQLKGYATIASISISSNNNDILCGSATVTVSNTTAPSIALSDVTAKTVTLDCGDGIHLNANTATAFIIALPPMTMFGGFTVTVTDTESKQMEIKTTKAQTISRSNLLSMPVVNYVGTGIDPTPVLVGAVDLGLQSGILWGACNLGANLPEGYGDYYAWGETEPYYKEGHSRDNPCYDWKDGKERGYSSASYSYGDPIFGYTKYTAEDNKAVLELCDDAANVKLGDYWRIPTFSEWDELLYSCSWTWTTRNGVTGLSGIGPNGNTIFLPAAGYRSSESLSSFGTYCQYWTSSLRTWGGRYPYSFYFYSADVGDNISTSDSRMTGMSIRPVYGAVHVSDIVLNRESLVISEGRRALLSATVSPCNAAQQDVIWSSSNNTVATVDANGTVTTVGVGSATITATTIDCGLTATCEVTVEEPSEDELYRAVDFGLPSGLKWATCNLCEGGFVNSPEEFGDYYAWGETEPYYSSLTPLIWKDGKTDGYTWTSYKWCNGTGSTLTRYNTYANEGTVDDKTDLSEYDYVDDVARQRLGGRWRIPSSDEWAELLEYCTCVWTNQNGVEGVLITGPNNNSIFLPAAGGWEGTNRYDSFCGYWLSSIASSTSGSYYPFYASGITIRKPDTSSGPILYRCCGLSVRPVI